LGGYPSSIYLLALANEHCGKVVHPRAIYTSSETLFRFQREAIQRSFGCKVYTYYGNGERAGFIAECPEGSLHVKLDHSLVELVNDKGEDASPGEIGRLICTAFGNVATPLIRYNVGDTAILSSVQECPCARGGMLIEELTGRTEDYVVTPDGRFVGRLDHLFKDSVKVRAAQIVQDKVDTILIRIVKEHDYSSRDESEILREATSRLGDDIDIDIEYVSDIERAKSGKHRFIISNLSEKRIYGRGIRSVD
jgi:phenylacetate-CoA ligase